MYISYIIQKSHRYADPSYLLQTRSCRQNLLTSIAWSLAIPYFSLRTTRLFLPSGEIRTMLFVTLPATYANSLLSTAIPNGSRNKTFLYVRISDPFMFMHITVFCPVLCNKFCPCIKRSIVSGQRIISPGKECSHLDLPKEISLLLPNALKFYHLCDLFQSTSHSHLSFAMSVHSQNQ